LIIESFYWGDYDLQARLSQRQVYVTALEAITSRCYRFGMFARELLEDETHREWASLQKYEVRTFEAALDLLAAAWRSYNAKNDFRQPHFPSMDRLLVEESGYLWVEWLHKELADWINRSHLVRSVLVIRANQNKPVGYAAMDRFCLDLLERFDDVPWHSETRDAYEHDIPKARIQMIKSCAGVFRRTSENT